MSQLTDERFFFLMTKVSTAAYCEVQHVSIYSKIMNFTKARSRLIREVIFPMVSNKSTKYKSCVRRMLLTCISTFSLLVANNDDDDECDSAKTLLFLNLRQKLRFLASGITITEKYNPLFTGTNHETHRLLGNSMRIAPSPDGKSSDICS